MKKQNYDIKLNELNDIYEEISNTIKVSCCNWYAFGEQSNKYLLTLEKKLDLSKYFAEDLLQDSRNK